MKKRNVLWLLIAGLILSGCGAPKGCREDRSSGLSEGPLPPPTFGEVTIAGAVRFDGTPPEMKTIATATHCGSGEIREEWAVINPDGGLANVLVYLEDAPRSSGINQPPITLDQVDCMFTPRVVAVQVEQPLLTRSSDAELHNVHYQPTRNANTNYSLKMGEQRTVSFSYAEPQPVEVKCDVHPWMNGYIAVLAHPFFAVTDEAGRFAIERVPAGQYTLRAWHERFGTRQETITVADAGELTQDFRFGRRGS